jgi:integrase
MPKLTNNFINTKIDFTEPGKVAFYRDDELTGFCLKVTHTSMTYFAECRVNGATRRVTIGRHPLWSPDDARQKARVILGKMAAGVDPRKPEGRNITLREAFQEYMDSRPMRRNTVYSFNRIMNKELADWLDKPVTRITKQMVVERYRQLIENHTKGTNGYAAANVVMHTLRACLYYVSFKYAVGNEVLIPENPVTVLGQMRLWKKLPPRQGVIPDHKLAPWYQAVMLLGNPTARDYYLVLILTGLRRSEAARLEWTDIDLEAGTLTVRQEIAKNAREHRLPLSDFLLDLMLRRKGTSKGSPFVFPGYRRKGRYHGCYRTVKYLREASGCDFIVHDLRRNFLTMAERVDTPHHVLKKLAGHSNREDVTSDYLIVGTERMRPFMQAITDKFLEVMGVREPRLAIKSVVIAKEEMEEVYV